MPGSALAALLLIMAADPDSPSSPQDAQCRVVRIAADGARSETGPTETYKGPPKSSGGSVSSTDSGRSAHSSASVSSHSSSSGPGSTVTRTSDGRRSITKTYDDKGCTIVIDDRPAQGGR